MSDIQRYKPDNDGRLWPDADGEWVSYCHAKELIKKLRASSKRKIDAERDRCIAAVDSASGLDENGYIAEKSVIIKAILSPSIPLPHLTNREKTQ